MDNVPDRLLQVYNNAISDKEQPQVETCELLAGSSNTAQEFILPHIDHTLGYIIKYELE